MSIPVPMLSCLDGSAVIAPACVAWTVGTVDATHQTNAASGARDADGVPILEATNVEDAL